MTLFRQNHEFYHADFAISSTFQNGCKNQYNITLNEDNIWTIIFGVIIVITILTAAHPGSYSNILDLHTIALNDSDVHLCSTEAPLA